MKNTCKCFVIALAVCMTLVVFAACRNPAADTPSVVKTDNGEQEENAQGGGDQGGGQQQGGGDDNQNPLIENDVPDVAGTAYNFDTHGLVFDYNGSDETYRIMVRNNNKPQITAVFDSAAKCGSWSYEAVPNQSGGTAKGGYYAVKDNEVTMTHSKDNNFQAETYIISGTSSNVTLTLKGGGTSQIRYWCALPAGTTFVLTKRN